MISVRQDFITKYICQTQEKLSPKSWKPLFATQLKKRERYGLRIDPDGNMYQSHLDFIEWAKSYDNGGTEIRSKAMHDKLEKSFLCKVLHLNGANKLDDNFNEVLNALNTAKV